MTDILTNRAKNSIGMEVTVFLKNGFRYAGKLTNADDRFIEVLDRVSESYKIININEIRDLEVKE